jgi:hypothetical protein
VLKKAGIVVAAAAAGLLAVSPLAFAGDKDDRHGHGHGHDKTKVEDINTIDNSSEGLINVSGNNLAVPVNVCDNQLALVAVEDTLTSLTGALAILGGAEADSVTVVSDECEAEAEAGDESEIDD